MIKVLVVDDSSVVREFLVHILSSDPDISVVGTARDGEEAVEFVRRQRPDVITMDIHMPKLNGLDATRLIMETDPTPIVIVSGSEDPSEVATTFNAMDAGALAVLRRPVGIGHPDHESMAQDMVQTVKLMSEVKVIRRWPRKPATSPAPQLAYGGRARGSAKTRIVAIGASTGGPPALETILTALPRDFPVPILIVQHMAPGFIGGFARWLAASSGLPVHVATQGESLLPGHVYVAPDDHQMKVEREGKIALTKHDPEHGLRPSISYLFRSVAEVYGPDAVAGLLTGMGRDGAGELRLLKEHGAVTFAQDKDSSVVHGMPGEAIKLDAATLILPLEKIAKVLANLVNHTEKLERDVRHSK
jgi:two-component system chemotaxis response regulator CheB